MSGKMRSGWFSDEPWPVISGNYVVGDPEASIAVCTLTSPELMEPLSKIKGVAIAGRLNTVNLGIERIILNTISNPNIRFLLLCGKESPVFQPAQGIRSLFEFGVDDQNRIKKAEGHYPVLTNIEARHIDIFRKQVQLVDYINEMNLEDLQTRITRLSSERKNQFSNQKTEIKSQKMPAPEKSFKKIRPGGRRGTDEYDPLGFFVIQVDHQAGEMVLKHYHADHTPAHEMRGRRAESMMRGLVREGLISQLSHAGYLGVELGKAETALRLGIPYEQDHPIKKK